MPPQKKTSTAYEPRLTNADMRVERGVARSSRQVFVLPVRYVDVCPFVDVPLRQPEVNDVHEVAFLAESHQEIVRLDVPMYQVSRVCVLDSCDLPEEIVC